MSRDVAKPKRANSGRRPDKAKALSQDIVDALRRTVTALLVNEEVGGASGFVSDLADFMGEANPQQIEEALSKVNLSIDDIVPLAEFRDGLKQPPISPSTIERFIQSRTITTKSFVNTIYIYIVLMYTKVFEDNWRLMNTAFKEVFPRELRRIFRDRSKLTEESVQHIVGTFELYHPFHLDPGSGVLVSTLRVGVGLVGKRELGPFDAALEYQFERDKFPIHQLFDGKIVPHGDTTSLFLSTKQGAQIILYSDYETRNEVTNTFTGILVAFVGKDPASAWPFYARRVSDTEGALPRLVGISEAPEPALEHFGKGAIHWSGTYKPGYPYRRNPPERSVG